MKVTELKVAKGKYVTIVHNKHHISELGLFSFFDFICLKKCSILLQ